ncbi:DUF2252 family protein [bacterium]|nr:DUF2252 family protein [bacterium]
MMIPPAGSPEPRAALVRVQATPIKPQRPAEAPTLEAVDSTRVSGLAAPGPQRSSSGVTGWRNDYEGQLGLSESALSSRKSALKAGGPEMLYRMYPLLFQQDLQGPYQTLSRLLPEKGPEIALAGDCHLGNFGTLRNQNRDLVWSLNDYDQVGKGRPELDLCRAGASLVLLCRERGWSHRVAGQLVRELTHQYTKHISQYCQEKPGPVLGIRKDEAEGPVHSLLKKAERRSQEDLLAKWTQMGQQGTLKFKLGEELRKPDEQQQARLDQLLQEIRLPATVRLLDRCCRLDAGGSSLGLERYYLLAQKEGESLPVVLELKQVLPCALATSDPDPKKCDAQLLQDGFKWLGAPKDNWQRVVRGDNGVYLLRERQRARDALKTEDLSSEDAHKVAKHMGQLLAQAHAHGASPTKIRDWIDGREDDLAGNLLKFSSSYAEQAEQDYAALFK